MPTAIRRTAAPVATPPVPTPGDDQLVHNLFTFSPFGLGCRQCQNNSTIQLDERCISRHLKKHGMDSKVSNIRSIIEEYKKRITAVKASGTIQPYRLDNESYKGWSCVCGHNFYSRKDSANRHCKRNGCDPKRLQKVNLIKLCCGRYVTQAQIDSFLSTMILASPLNSIIHWHEPFFCLFFPRRRNKTTPTLICITL